MQSEADSQEPPLASPDTSSPWARRVAQGFLYTFLLPATIWATLAVYWSNLPSPLGGLAAAAYGAAGLMALLFVRPRGRGQLTALIMFLGVLGWWWSISPSQQRNWRKDFITLPYAESASGLVTIHNIRNCNYRSETDYDVRYYDKTVDLARLESMDLYFAHSGSRAMAHTMVSFGFGGNQFVCFSIEGRCEVQERYSSLKGFFKQFERICLAADERDVVRLRTNYRKEEVYLYRLRAKPEAVRAIFLRYCQQMNALRARPDWYNPLTRNCTANIPGPDGSAPRGYPRTWAIALPGYLPGWIYDQQITDTSLPFAELKKHSLVNARAQGADQDPNFSVRIREGLPELEPRR
jgi:hypothetical protein